MGIFPDGYSWGDPSFYFPTQLIRGWGWGTTHYNLITIQEDSLFYRETSFSLKVTYVQKNKSSSAYCCLCKKIMKK